jgi:hypothetical protein
MRYIDNQLGNLSSYRNFSFKEDGLLFSLFTMDRPRLAH